VCDNHRGISLLSVPGKILARVILNRLTKHVTDQGRIQEFWKGGPVKGAKPRSERRRRERRRGVWGPPPKNFEKLDAISHNLAYIFGIRMASDIIQNSVAATFSKHTDIR